MKKGRREQFYEQPPGDRLGDAPIEAAHHEHMVSIAHAIDEIFNGSAADREVGFVLLVFPFSGREGRCNFISNGASRKDIVALFKEMIARFEGQPEMPGLA